MKRDSRKIISGVSSHITVLIIIGLIAGGSVMALLLSKPNPAVDEGLTPLAARVERVEGDVGIVSAFDGGEEEWTEATINAPLTEGDRIEARDNSRATLAFTGRRYARLDPGAAIDVLSLSDQRTQLALRDGSALFDLSDLGQGELFEVATPQGAFDFVEPGLYQVGYGDDGSSWISVLSGLAQVVGLSGTGEIGTGEILTLAAQVAAPLLISKLAPDLAGGIVDDYYGYRYPDYYDGRYREYDRYLDDPFYYDPYRRSASYRYVNYDVPGVRDLDYYGDWIDDSDYGRCWSPRVETGWSPYRDGYWHNDNVWGPTWVSRERWGWAPYHYGRWAHTSGGRWVWVPDSISSPVSYSPALVAFVPIEDNNHIGWVPLAPGERYVHRYYDSSYNTRYLASPDDVKRFAYARRSYRNLSVPEAVTVVPIDRFTGLIRPDAVARVNQRWIASSQPVLDPYEVAGLRQLAQNKKEWKRHLKRERKLARRSENAPVVTSVPPTWSRFDRGAVERIPVNTVGDRDRKRKLKMERRAQIAQSKATGAPVIIQRPLPAVEAQRAQALNQIERERKKEAKRLRKQEKRLNQAAAPQVITQPAAAQKAQRKEAKRLRRAASNPVRVQAAPPINNQAQLEAQRAQRRAQKQARKQQRQAIERTPKQAVAPQVVQSQQIRKAQKQARREQRRQESLQSRPASAQRAAPVVRPQTRPQQVNTKQARPQAVNRGVSTTPQVKQAGQNKAQRKAEKAQRKAARGKN
jgi:hypothetical protein